MTPEEVPDDVRVLDDRFSAVRDEAARQVAQGLRPSIQIYASFRGDTVVDLAVGARGTPDASYLLWSTTKPFVALALLQMIEDGRARLEDRVTEYLPEFGVGGKERATLVHLLTHRGGFPDSAPQASRALSAVQLDWDAAIAHVCAMEALWKPGCDRGYHPRSSWFVLGEVIQRIEDRPLAEVIDARVLGPCGIAREEWSLGQPERLASAVLPVSTQNARGAPSPTEAAFFSDPATHRAVIPGASGISNARAVARLYETLLAGGTGPGGRLLSPQMVRAATFPHAVGIIDRTFLTDLPFGLGFHLKHARPTLDDCGDSATPGTFGHAGHFLVNTAWADPGKGVAAAILANGLSPARAGQRGANRLSQAIHDAVDGILRV